MSKKSFFWKFCCFQTLRNFERNFTLLGEKVSGREIKIEKCSFRLIRSIKKPNFWKFSFFPTLQNFERTFTVLGEKVLGRGIKLENCTLCLQSINLRIKIVFWKFCKFSFVSDLEHEIFGFVATEFSLGLSKCILLGYMNSLWDVGNRSDITWRESLFEPWQKNFDLFVKTALYVSKGTIWVKKQLLKVLIFFKLFRILNEHSPCLAKIFSAGISKLKIAVFVSKDQSKNQTSESSLFFPILQNFERRITVLGKKGFGRDIKIESCSLRLIRSNKKSNFWKISFFFKIFRTLNEQLPCLAKKFWAGVSKLKIVLYVFRVSFWG